MQIGAWVSVWLVMDPKERPPCCGLKTNSEIQSRNLIVFFRFVFVSVFDELLLFYFILVFCLFSFCRFFVSFCFVGVVIVHLLFRPWNTMLKLYTIYLHKNNGEEWSCSFVLCKFFHQASGGKHFVTDCEYEGKIEQLGEDIAPSVHSPSKA